MVGMVDPMKPYWTLRVPWVPMKFRTQWHPTEAVGPFKVLTRGAFSTEEEAIEWGRTHLGGCPYELVEVGWT